MNDMNRLAAVLDQALDLGLQADERWFRADVCHGLALREGHSPVDRGAGIIYGYSVVTKGLALGHDMAIDETTLSQVVALGNASKMGVKSRFDHPNASNTSMGTFLGRTKNFRKAGDRVLGDLYLSESAKEAPQGDLYTYVLGLAERDPQAFGASIVFEGKAEPQLNKDGTQKKDDMGNPLPRLARVEALLASDVVDDPAANAGGLFQKGDHLASKITSFLNRWAQHELLPTLQASLAAHKEVQTMTTETAPKESMFTAAQLDVIRSDGHQAGVKAERERVSAIRKSFVSVWGDKAPAIELTVCDGLLDMETSAADAEKIFKTRKLAQITDAAPKTAGGGEEPPRTQPLVDLSKLPLDERCKVEWETNVNGVREEFGSLSTYLAFAQADANGTVKILTK